MPTGGVSRRGFLGAIAAALVLDPERALWVPGAKKIFLPPAPRVVRFPMFNVGDVVKFFDDEQRFVCMAAGDPESGFGASFAFLHGQRLPVARRVVAGCVSDSDSGNFRRLAATHAGVRPPFLEISDPPRGHMYVDVPRAKGSA